MSEPVPVPLRALLGGKAARRPDPVQALRAEMASAVAAARAEALAEAGARIAALEAALHAAETDAVQQREAQAEAARAVHAALEAALDDAVVPLALAIAGRVVEGEPASAALAASLARGAIAGHASGAVGEVRLPPDLAALAPPLPDGWQLVADPALPSGTAIAEAGALLAQDSLALRMAQLAAALRRPAEQPR
jgi:hypothetical protein